MNKLLVICGPTATGKTELAIKLAKKFNGEVVSADSKQVYKGMDIGTGKDIPENSTKHFQQLTMHNSQLAITNYRVGKIKIWGYDLAHPKDEFSVAQYTKIAEIVINDILGRDKLPIIVGGTGLYIKAIVDGIDTSNVPRNANLRNRLNEKTVDELYEILAQVDSIKAASMNESDKNNPRRLVRAIEVASSKQTVEFGDQHKASYDTFFVGLSTDSETLHGKINKRVEKRIKQGFEEELRDLLVSGVSWEMQSMSSLGYKQWRGVLVGKRNRSQAIDDWKRAEIKYSKRQMTWFKKDKRVNWFDVSKEYYTNEVEKLMNKWYKF